MKNLTDKEIIDLILSSNTVEEWNDQRELIKSIRSNEWVAINIDQKGLIHKSKIPKKNAE